MKRKNFSLVGRTLVGLTVAASAWTFSGFTAEKEKALAEACFEFTGDDDPDNSQATDEGAYEFLNMGTPSCVPLRETLCGICFDTDQFPLVGGQPNFADPVLANLINANKTNGSLHGSTITDTGSGKSIRLYFRERQ